MLDEADKSGAVVIERRGVQYLLTPRPARLTAGKQAGSRSGTNSSASPAPCTCGGGAMDLHGIDGCGSIPDLVHDERRLLDDPP